VMKRKESSDVLRISKRHKGNTKVNLEK
jgi:hypothetical protein